MRNDVPSLAALVVNKQTKQVGADFGGDPEAERAALYAHWSA